MNGSTRRHSLTLAIHPTARGFGWVAFEGPFSPYDWGVVGAQGDKNAMCLRKLEALWSRLCPATLVLETYSRGRSARSNRISRLCSAMASYAGEHGAEVMIYSRNDIRACFASVGARTRREIAEAVARHVTALSTRLPRPTKPWETEDRRYSIFAAAALGLTHYQTDVGR
jgi:hypothetical protein